MSKFERFLDWLCYSPLGMVTSVLIALPIAVVVVGGLWAIFALALH